MGIIKFAVENPVKVTVGVILLVLFGILSLLHLGIQLTPDVDRPVITVMTMWEGASPEEIEREIVDRQEEKLKSVRGLKKMTSTSTQNQAKVELEFQVGVDQDVVYRDVSDKLRQVSDYPEEVDEPTISTADAGMERTIAWIILASNDGSDVSHLKTFIEDHVKPILERAEGISEVDVYGGSEREVQVVIDAPRLASRGLSFREVEEALRRQNDDISAGTIPQGKRDYTYRALGEYRTIADIENTVIAYQSGGPVYVRDVASVVDGYKKAVSFVRSQGRPVIAIPARRETGANVIEATENLKRQIELVNREILQPQGLGLELTQVYDETVYIWSAIRLVVDNIFSGGVLAVLVLLLFLRSFSATSIIAVTMPISVIGTFLFIALLGRSLNVIMLAGMAFAVGNSVDSAIVVLENIHRHRAMGKTRFQASLDGSKEVWGAVFASTMTTMAVFLPVVFVQGEAGQLFKDIAIASAIAAALALVVSVIVIPPLTARFFGSDVRVVIDKPWVLGSIAGNFIRRLNRSVVARCGVAGGLTAMSIVLAWLLMPGAEYLPTGNKNLVFGFLFSPPGYSLDEYRRMGQAVEDGDPDDPSDGLRPSWEAPVDSEQAKALSPVQMHFGRKGRIVRDVRPPPIDNFFFVSFDGGAFMGATSKEPTNVRPLADVMTRAGSRLPGVFTLFHQHPLFNAGIRSGNTVDLEIRGNDLDEVVQATLLVQMKVQEQGYDRPSPTPANFDLGRPEVQLVPNRVKSADLGLNVRDLGFFLQAAIDGAFVGEFNDRGSRIDMALRIANTETASVNDIAQIPIFTPTGHLVPLSAAVDFNRTTSPQQIVRIEEMSSVTLSVPPKAGVPLQDAMQDLDENVIKPLRASGALPASIITALGGNADKLTQTRHELIGDFQDTVVRPRLFGWGVLSSMGLLIAVALAAAVAGGLVFGRRIAVRIAIGALSVLTLGFLAANPTFSLTLLQSRVIIALLITYLLMAALFESFVYPFVMMFSVPPAALGGFAALRIVHEASLYDPALPIQHLDVLTMLGFVILIGIVTNNAILIVHQALNYMRDEGMTPHEAVAYSVQTRTRPIFMTALTSIVGMFPLVIRPGAGSELYRGLGSVILGGLLVSTVFTLAVVPSVFTLFVDLQNWLKARAAVPAASSSHRERTRGKDLSAAGAASTAPSLVRSADA